MTKKRVKTNFRNMALGTSQRAGFIALDNVLHKRFFADKKKKTFATDRMVVQEKDVSTMLKKVHDEAGHVGIGNTRRNCKKADSFKI